MQLYMSFSSWRVQTLPCKLTAGATYDAFLSCELQLPCSFSISNEFTDEKYAGSQINPAEKREIKSKWDSFGISKICFLKSSSLVKKSTFNFFYASLITKNTNYLTVVLNW